MASKVPLLDLTRADARELDGLRAAFERVLTSGRYILGEEVEAFEREIADYLEVPHAIGVSSGTDALLLALMALRVGAGDEVICPTYTFFATAGTIWRLGARPVFVDCDPLTYNCDVAGIEARISERTKAIMPVHLFGQAAEMGPIVEIAAERGIPIVEDAAQAIGARWEGKRVGSIGSFGCFSFFPSKNLGCLGDGGLVTTGDADLCERARILRVHGGREKYFHREVGANLRLDALQAAFLRVRLPRLDATSEARRRNADAYRALLREAGVVSESPVEVPVGRVGLPEQVAQSHIYNQFLIRVAAGRRDAIRAALERDGIGTAIYYPVPLHLQECFAQLGHREGDLPHAERAARETIALPIFPELTAGEMRTVVDRLAAACRE